MLEGIAPMVPVNSLETSLPFYTGVLGFDLRSHAPDSSYALLARDEAGIILLGGANAESLKATARNISAYIWVGNLDALWLEMSAELLALPEGRVRAPFTQPYGMREFHVKDPDGFLILFGQQG